MRNVPGNDLPTNCVWELCLHSLIHRASYLEIMRNIEARLINPEPSVLLPWFAEVAVGD